MKKLILLICFFSAFGLSAQEFPGLDASPMDASYFPDGQPLDEVFQRDVRDLKIKIYYSRPQLKGRKMLGGEAAPFGEVWRLGANEAPEITFYEDVTFGDQKVSAGTYAIFAIPGEKEWEFILSSKLNTWGNYTTKEDQFVARTKTSVVKSSEEPIEVFSIMFKEVSGGAHMVVGWQNTIVELPIKL
ncbi:MULTISPECIES: DUF2911 domain-containing protein [Roseivirga]|uniref:Asparagine synthetase B n=1 Tax=Roseivirga spongicola TaxID=333140 RepID=A0A150X535_9BACT|nr:MULTISPECIES: DUF2911 domain-containing protein [Roseivirga]KYG73818.1 hypothetical protein AWW68_14190 [Roseivirga spongicola]MBO6660110.1 DUF2911 domain-containing protein [Roseivirga sp.]MBO6907153.1 DUF2911 domain-containing protein [Roseivirga sp.]WPZ09540.1 DUF2911 domain-containing protein [Roseivirga spongicola]